MVGGKSLEDLGENDLDSVLVSDDDVSSDDISDDISDDDFLPLVPLLAEGYQDYSDDSDDRQDEFLALVPATGSGTGTGTTEDTLTHYLREIGRYKLLSVEQEKELTKALAETGDIEIAKALVRANLRLVVKIAMEYRYAYPNVLDLIQEGNIGLMKAVSKYDGSKGAKLSYYSSWWIRSYILKFILDNFRLIKIGTSGEQKKLFYNLMKEKDRLLKLGIGPTHKKISQELGVSEKNVALMEERLSPQGAEIGIDVPGKKDELGGRPMSETLASDAPLLEDQLAWQQGLNILNNNLKDFLSQLKERDRYIFEQRLLSEIPPSLQHLADEFGVSRERIRQIEERLMKKLKAYMAEYLR